MAVSVAVALFTVNDKNGTKQQPTKVGGFEKRLKVNQRLKPSL